MPTLSPRASFWVAAAVAGVALWTSAAPSLTYPLYAAEWHLSTTVTTSIFATYPAVIVVVLIVAGDLSDHIGRRAAILLGLTASLLGSVLFAVAEDVPLLFVGRAFLGVGVGLAFGPATAAMVELSAAGGAKKAGAITTAATAVGLILATVVGGGLIQYAPFPTHLNFWVLAIVVAFVLMATWFMPRPVQDGPRQRWRPRIPEIGGELHRLFRISAVATVGAYAAGAVLLGLGASIARDLIQSRNALVNGAVIALTSATIGGVALFARGAPARPLIRFGGCITVLGMAMLVASSTLRQLPIFLVSAVLIGAGYSLLFVGGLDLLNSEVPQRHRQSAISAVYLVAYLGQGMIAVALGVVATVAGLTVAVNIGASIVGVLALAAAIVASPRRAADNGRVGAPKRIISMPALGLLIGAMPKSRRDGRDVTAPSTGRTTGIEVQHEI